MERVLVVEPDDDLRESLRVVLEYAGYAVAACAESEVAAELLQVVSSPLVVLVSHGGLEQHWRAILSAVPSLGPHAYLLLSSEPRQAPWQWNPYTGAFVPVVPMPFELDLLLDRVADASRRLQSWAGTPGVRIVPPHQNGRESV